MPTYEIYLSLRGEVTRTEPCVAPVLVLIFILPVNEVLIYANANIWWDYVSAARVVAESMSTLSYLLPFRSTVVVYEVVLTECILLVVPKVCLLKVGGRIYLVSF